MALHYFYDFLVPHTHFFLQGNFVADLSEKINSLPQPEYEIENVDDDRSEHFKVSICSLFPPSSYKV